MGAPFLIPAFYLLFAEYFRHNPPTVHLTSRANLPYSRSAKFFDVS